MAQQGDTVSAPAGPLKHQLRCWGGAGAMGAPQHSISLPALPCLTQLRQLELGLSTLILVIAPPGSYQGAASAGSSWAVQPRESRSLFHSPSAPREVLSPPHTLTSSRGLQKQHKARSNTGRGCPQSQLGHDNVLASPVSPGKAKPALLRPPSRAILPSEVSLHLAAAKLIIRYLPLCRFQGTEHCRYSHLLQTL